MAGGLLRGAYRILKKLKLIGYRRRYNVFGIHPLLISTIFLILTEIIASTLRRLIRRLVQDEDSFWRLLLLEFIATAELCACCFELIIIADNYGVFAYAIYLFLLTLWWSSRWERESACPYTAFEEVLEGDKKLQHALCVIISQVLGGLAIAKYIEFTWSLELAETHRGRSEEECTADLQVSPCLGMVVEGVATCVCRIVSRMLAEAGGRWSGVKDAFFGTVMVVLAFNYSGGYFNPALATSLKFGCKGHTVSEHLLVYWVGSFAGSVLAVLLFKAGVIKKSDEGGGKEDEKEEDYKTKED